MEKGICFLAVLALTACGAPEYDGREVGSDETDMTDGMMGAAGMGGSADSSEEPVEDVFGNANDPAMDGGEEDASSMMEAGGDSGSNTDVDSGAAGDGDSEEEEMDVPEWTPTFFYQDLPIPEVDASTISEPSLEQWLYAGECVGVERALEELASISIHEAQDRGSLSWTWNRWINAAWARVEILRWRQNCQQGEFTGLNDREVIQSMCPEGMTFGDCIENADPRDYLNLTVTEPDSAMIRLSDLACYAQDGDARVSVEDAADRYDTLLAALETPTPEEAAAFSATIQMSGLGGKNVPKGYALVATAVHALGCLARQTE